MTNSALGKVAIIGAGPAGLTAAYQLCKFGIKVEIFEAEDTVGGMAKSIDLWGQRVDLGPHRFFSNDPRVNKLWLELVGRDYEMVQRLSRIYYGGTFFDYPLKALNTFANLGAIEAFRCLFSYLAAMLKPVRNDVTFEDWVSNRFGKRLYSIFFKSYSEKLWGISCRELDADFAAQRIKKLSLWEAVRSAVWPKSAENHKTLVDEFAYPKGGAGIPYERMAQFIVDNGGSIHLGTRVQSVLVEGGFPKVVLESGKIEDYGHVVSSMPLTMLVKRMNAPAHVIENAGKLRFRNTILVYLKIDAGNPFADQWIYVHAPDLATGRITNFSNWGPSILQDKNETILCLEYWCNDDDRIWSDDEEALVARAKAEIVLTGLVRADAVSAGKAIRVPKCYPVYSTGYKESLAPVVEYLSSLPFITPIGRYGSFKYNNQDHSILMGLLAAENIAGIGSHDLWAINTDYEYQEKSRITATGLVMQPALSRGG